MLCLSLLISVAVMPKIGAKLASAAEIFPILDTVSAESRRKAEFLPDEIKGEAALVSAEPQEEKAEEKSETKTKKEKAAGNIISQFFSPYNANTSYNNTYLNNQSGEKVNIKSLLQSGKTPKLDVNSSEPQVLIIHTHATENYMTHNKDYYTDSDLERTKKENESVVGVGAKLKEELEAAGISVIHDKTLHDSPSYSGAYSRSYETASKYLKKNKSIKVVLDIHRDAIAQGDDIVKPVTEVKGKKAAQVMICVGSETGSVSQFPNWRDNLAFGLKTQQALEVLYPGLARPLYLAYEREYNQSISSGAIIIEFGTNANTFSEAEYSAELVGKALGTVLKN